jgi:hypothetical protein
MRTVTQVLAVTFPTFLYQFLGSRIPSIARYHRRFRSINPESSQEARFSSPIGFRVWETKTHRLLGDPQNVWN